MRILESNSNPKIKRGRRVLAMRDPEVFIIEGEKLFDEAIRSKMLFEDVFVTRQAWMRHQEMLARLQSKNVPVHLITQNLAKQISDLETPPGLAAILKRPVPTRDVFLKNASVFLIGLRDPGNVGTIIRTAEGAGCDAVFYSHDCADPFQPKVVRSSMGSIFRMPLMEIRDVPGFILEQKSRQVSVCALVSSGQVELDRWNPSFPLLICVGSESQGLPSGLPVTENISIPMEGKVESLNAAIAASICLYWIRLKCRNQN